MHDGRLARLGRADLKRTGGRAGAIRRHSPAQLAAQFGRRGATGSHGGRAHGTESRRAGRSAESGRSRRPLRGGRKSEQIDLSAGRGRGGGNPLRRRRRRATTISFFCPAAGPAVLSQSRGSKLGRPAHKRSEWHGFDSKRRHFPPLPSDWRRAPRAHLCAGCATIESLFSPPGQKSAGRPRENKRHCSSFGREGGGELFLETIRPNLSGRPGGALGVDLTGRQLAHKAGR